jgi:hypothetical protein
MRVLGPSIVSFSCGELRIDHLNLYNDTLAIDDFGVPQVPSPSDQLPHRDNGNYYFKGSRVHSFIGSGTQLGSPYDVDQLSGVWAETFVWF